MCQYHHHFGTPFISMFFGYIYISVNMELSSDSSCVTLMCVCSVLWSFVACVCMQRKGIELQARQHFFYDEFVEYKTFCNFVDSWLQWETLITLFVRSFVHLKNATHFVKLYLVSFPLLFIVWPDSLLMWHFAIHRITNFQQLNVYSVIIVKTFITSDLRQALVNEKSHRSARSEDTVTLNERIRFVYFFLDLNRSEHY